MYYLTDVMVDLQGRNGSGGGNILLDESVSGGAE